VKARRAEYSGEPMLGKKKVKINDSSQIPDKGTEYGNSPTLMVGLIACRALHLVLAEIIFTEPFEPFSEALGFLVALGEVDVLGGLDDLFASPDLSVAA